MIHASKMRRISACPGSHSLCERLPGRPPGPAAKLGILAAALAEDCLKSDKAPLEYVGGEIDVEMATHVSMYVDYCRTVPGQHFVEAGMRDETGGIAGTPDFLAWDGRTLTIVDLKYGFGWVEVVNNMQLLTYLALWYAQNRIEPAFIRLVIIQPRANHPDGPVREWDLSGLTIRSYTNYVHNAVRAALIDNPECRAGVHCKDTYCPAILFCETNRAAVAGCMDFAGMASYTEMDPAHISRELGALEQAAKLINSRLAAMEEYAGGLIQAGKHVPGYTYDTKPGALQWVSDDPIAQLSALGKDISGAPKPITPTQAINRKIVPEGMVKLLARRAPGVPKLRRVNLNKINEMIERHKS